MRVLFIVTAFPRAAGDVITPWLLETIRRLGRVGVGVEVLAPSYRGLGDQLWEGVPVHRFRYAPRGWETLTHDQTAPDRVRQRPAYLGLVPTYVLAGTWAAARLARSGRFDVIHAFWPIPHSLLGIGAKQVSGVPLISTFFGVELTWLDSQLRMLRPVLRSIVAASDAVTAISSYTAAMLKRLAPAAEPVVIPFGAAFDDGARAAGAMDRPDGRPFTVLFVGRLVQRKGVRYLLEAVAQVKTRRKLVLRVVGDGSERASLEAHAAKLGATDVVRFTGFVPDEELAQEIAGCDVLVLPAVVDEKGDTEGLGVVLIEALGHGKPVIASRIGGIPDVVIDGETGLLVPPADANALANALERLIDDPGLAATLAAAGRRHVEEIFSWDAIVRQLTDIYGSVAGATRATRGGAART